MFRDSEDLFYISDLRAFLKGIWKLERRIDDHLGGESGGLVGKATLRGEGAALDYREEGILTLGAHSGAAYQAYRYDFPSNARAAVSFTDGRFFHDLDLSGGIWTATHRCGDDRYDGEFAALDPDVWRVVWQVKGPRKDLALDSLYRREV